MDLVSSVEMGSDSSCSVLVDAYQGFEFVVTPSWFVAARYSYSK